MREETFTIQIYKYSELSDEAKENAYDKFCENDHHHHWFDDQFESLKSFLKWSGISITRYEIGAYCHSYINTDIPEDDQQEIRTMEVECRLLGLDEQDTEDRLLQSFDQMQIDTNRISPNYPEETLKHWGCGDGLDQDIIHWWNEHLKENPLDNIGALHAVVEAALSHMVGDMEYEGSKEYFEEREDDYENDYLEDGTLH
tara:strand:+ start:418 stop:1017 length:600 start_codon:yes stop_codon:yes gene_type:complete